MPELGPPLPGDLGPAIVKSQQPVTPTYAPPGHDPEDARRKEADAAAASTVFFRAGQQGKAAAHRRTAAPGSALRASTRSPLGQPRRRPSHPTRLPCKTGKTRKRLSERRFYGNRNSGNLQMPASPLTR